MKAVQLYQRAGPERLRVEDRPAPAPGDGEILIKVHAAAVTPTELLWAPTWKTQTGNPRSLPVVPGHEFSGTVGAVGKNVQDFAVGQAVYGVNNWFGDGAQAEFCVTTPSEIALKPVTLDHAEAAVVPISALTAWQGLVERARVSKEMRVLIHGGAGAVGLFAVQLAHARGAHVTTTVSAHNIEFVRSLGADEVIHYRTARFENVVPEMDVVFDTVGGETLARSWRVLKPGGKMITVAASEEGSRDARAQEAFFIVEANHNQLVEIGRLLDAQQLHPVVDAVFPLAQALEAYDHKTTRGKAVLQVVL